MKKLLIALVLLGIVSCTDKNVYKLIPEPAKLVEETGKFDFDNAKIIKYEGDSTTGKVVDYFNNYLIEEHDTKLLIDNDSDEYDIIVTIDENADSLINEGYVLNIERSKIEIKAYKNNGLFYAMQTIKQLFPTDGENLSVPQCKIVDVPKFKWRGLNLDCCRHFMEKEFVKRYIDLLAYHKMNTLHWHLTEDQGWRIEIKKYPRLTEIGAYRKYDNDSTYGGFYTQEDIKEIVEYAESRFVNVIPEIEMPGHSTAALASYPELSCTGGPFEVGTQWGVYKDVYCAGNEKTFTFLEDVLDEVIELFPGKYIHIGGDECPKDRWSECSLCQRRIRTENLKDEHELQSYFIKRMEKYLNSKGKQIVGWDEILEGGLAKGATVQSWRGYEGAVEAVRQGNHAIVSPTSHTYFDYPLSTTDLRQVYSFEPVPDSLTKEEADLILGSEANMWSERAPQEMIDSKLFPRILGLSEVLWTNNQYRNYDEFLTRVYHHYGRLDKLGVKYGYESKPVKMVPTFDKINNAFNLEIETGRRGLEIRYTEDKTKPTHESKLYEGELNIRNSAVVFARAFDEDRPVGEIESVSFTSHKALGKDVILKNDFSEKYSANGNISLVDGIRGTKNFRDGNWLGFEKDNFKTILDLEKPTDIRKISLGCLQSSSHWIVMPQNVKIYLSNDGENYSDPITIKNDVPFDNPDTILKEYKVIFKNLMKARYVKVTAENIGRLPEPHPAAGGKAWLFIDELAVE